MCYDKSNCGENSCNLNRRNFIKSAAGGTLLGASLFSNTPKISVSNSRKETMKEASASRYIPQIKAAFVRRKEEYGMRWPGAIYDVEAAIRHYRQQIENAGNEFGMNIDIRPAAIYSLKEAEQWLSEVKAKKSDGIFFVVLDRQEHSWPSAYKVIESNIPAVIFSPIGTAFTTNTVQADAMNKGLICSTDDFSQAKSGLKMLKAGTKLRETRVVVLKGNQRENIEINHFGTKLIYVPAQEFLKEYNNTQITEEVRQLADDYVKNARQVVGPNVQDVLNGIKSYLVARNIIKREGADAITMDCLGALGKTKVSLPCIAWSKLNDVGIPAICEADLSAVISQCLLQYLFDRPGFQQDPVADSSKRSLIGAHCSCPTRLNGFSEPSEPYFLSFHHGKRDAVPVTTWKTGQKVTVMDIVFKQTDSKRNRFAHRFPIDENEKRPEMIISSGEVIENISVPPSGGCVVSINIKLDGVDDSSDLLAYPGFHQLFFYGDYKRELQDYCRLFNIRPLVI